MHQKVS